MGSIVLWAVVGAAALASVPAAAQDGRAGRISLGVSAGTLGIGPEAGYRFNDTVGIRANATLFSISADYDSDDIEYEGEIDLRSGGIMLDLYPFGGGFRISGGARINGNKASLEATPTAEVEVGDVTYTPAQVGTLTGEADVKSFAPAVTLGFGGSLRRGLSLGIEAGALFQGSVRINDFTATGTLANDPAFRAELARERDELQDDVDDYKVYPILQLGLKYRF